MATQYSRQTARICTLQDLREGTWIQNEGLDPSGIQCSRGMISRASIIGVVINKPSEQSILVEDGTGHLVARTFDPLPHLDELQPGSLVNIIGRPREYNGERYLVLEVCKQLKQTAWAKYRKRELELWSGKLKNQTIQPAQKESAPAAPIPETIEVPVQDGKNPFEALIDTIRELDKGDGVAIDQLLDKVGHPEGEKFMQTLIEEGEIFEAKPGRVKVLE